MGDRVGFGSCITNMAAWGGGGALAGSTAGVPGAVAGGLGGAGAAYLTSPGCADGYESYADKAGRQLDNAGRWVGGQVNSFRENHRRPAAPSRYDTWDD